MAMVRKKQDDKYLEALRELITTGGGNRQCFDCGQRGPTYVNMTIGSFVCTRCSGVLRGLTPPHRVKSISMATFTQDEIDFLKAHGNDVCAKTWLGLWDPKRAVHQDQRELMIDKYERKRYYLEPASPLKSLTNATNLKTSSSATAAAAAAAASTSSSSTTSSNTTNTNNNNRSSNSNNSSSGNNASSQNHHTQIQLTPPTSQRTTANGLHKSSSTAISRPHHSTPQQHQQHQQQLQQQMQQQQQQQQQNGFNTDAFGLHNGLNISVGSASTGALSDTSSCASANGFGAEADFVADFGSADIFNATVASSPASSIGSSTTTNNGYAKIQPLKAAHQQFMNGHHGGGGNNENKINGILVNGNGHGNGFATNGNTENFADFDHAPIYNAAGEEVNYQFIRKNAIRKRSLRSGSLTIKPNERQLKDILEMDNPSDDPQPPTQPDYIQFTTDDVFNQASHEFNNIIDEFETFLTLSGGQQGQLPELHRSGGDMFAAGAVDGVVSRRPPAATVTKFTPLALAAHATAMAVLGNQNHFNTHFENSSVVSNSFSSSAAAATMSSNEKSLNAQWDAVWSTDNNHSATQQPSAVSTTAWQTTSSPFNIEQQEQNRQQLFGSLAMDQHYQQQQLPSSTFAYPALPSISSAFDTATPTVAAATSATTAAAAAAAASVTSLPMSNGINSNKNSTTTNGFNNNNNNNNNSANISAAPAADRYAALKDLDEQLRESKAVAAQAASIVTANVVESGFGNPNNGTVNPFATHAAVANPFQNTTAPQNTTQLFGQMTLIPNGIAAANGFLNAQKAQPNAGFFNYTANGFTNNANNNANAPAMYPAGGPNGCGFGFGTMQQQISATGPGLTANTFNNPFAASGALNSNNPFL